MPSHRILTIRLQKDQCPQTLLQMSGNQQPTIMKNDLWKQMKNLHSFSSHQHNDKPSQKKHYYRINAKQPHHTHPFHTTNCKRNFTDSLLLAIISWKVHNRIKSSYRFSCPTLPQREINRLNASAIKASDGSELPGFTVLHSVGFASPLNDCNCSNFVTELALLLQTWTRGISSVFNRTKHIQEKGRGSWSDKNPNHKVKQSPLVQEDIQAERKQHMKWRNFAREEFSFPFQRGIGLSKGTRRMPSTPTFCTRFALPRLLGIS